MSTTKDQGITRGSGNVFADLGYADADLRQLKAKLAAAIIMTLEDQHLTVGEAEARTGTAAEEFTLIRNAELGGFTVDRLMTVLAALNQEVNVQVNVRSRRQPS